MPSRRNSRPCLSCGETLAPFFLQDPRTGTAGAAFQAVAQLRAQEAADAWPFADGAEARHALSLMVNGLADGIDADDLVWEYRRLFVGPAPKPAPPWGSVYTDRECVVFGEGTLELRAWMRAHGVRRTTDERTPEDHIGLMLALMSYLARNQPDDLDEFSANPSAYLVVALPRPAGRGGGSPVL